MPTDRCVVVVVVVVAVAAAAAAAAAWTSTVQSILLCSSVSGDPYAVISLEAVAYSSYCNTVEWFWWG